MSAVQMLTRYPGLTAARVAALVLLVLALRLLIVPFALAAVLLERAQSSITDTVAAIEPQPSSTQDSSTGGEQR